jgi:hypothetical protein
MDTKKVKDEISNDLFSTASTKVIYLEGKTDPSILFGLLGLPQPPPSSVFRHQQTLVKGFSASDGSGNERVRARVNFAQLNGFAGQVFGIVDGDGEDLSILGSQFDHPHPGPLFAWKSYSIEGLFAQLPWPTTPDWGPAPNWQTELTKYASYVGINRLVNKIATKLETLKLVKYRKPITGQSLETVSNVEATLQADKGLILGFDAVIEFRAEVQRFLDALSRSPEEGLVMLNGKWLIDHFIVDRLKRSPDYWSQEWIRHAESIGGLLAVRELWERITGSPP